MADRRGAEGAAPVGTAAVVAVVRQLGPVIEGIRRRAAFAAAPELRAEGVQAFRLQVPNPDLPEVGRDVVAHVAAVEGERVRGAVELVDLAVE